MSGRPEAGDPDGQLDIEARFADIVAHFDDDSGEESTSWETESSPRSSALLDDAAVATADTAALDPGSDVRGPGPEEPPRASASAEPPVDREPTAADEAERRARIEREVDRAVDGPDGGRFVPPEPEPLPRQDLVARLSWLAVLVGPVLLIVAATTWRDIPAWAVGAVVVSIIVGFGILVSRLPRTRDHDDPDDGARV